MSLECYRCVVYGAFSSTDTVFKLLFLLIYWQKLFLDQYGKKVLCCYENWLEINKFDELQCILKILSPQKLVTSVLRRLQQWH
jgi:hypothetical protein